MNPRRTRRALRLFAGVLAVAVAAGAGVAHGELTRKGDLIVALQGDILPRTLPRERLAPVRVHVEGHVKSLNGTQPPELERLAIALNSQGRLYTRGLPRCTAGQLQQTSTRKALDACRPALVGHGHLKANVAFPDTAPFTAGGKVLAFNGRSGGKQAILIHVYDTTPTPLTFILPLKIAKGRGGTFGTLFSTKLPNIASELGYVTDISLTIGRRYRYAGKQRSFLSASCAAPAGFPGATFPFAKGTFDFSNGQTLSTSLIRDCRVRR